MEFQHVRLLPWVGPAFKTEMPWGLRILVLGESLYDGKPADPEFLRNRIDDVTDASAPERPRTLTRAAGVFYGRSPSPDEVRMFWRSAAFYDFIQEALPGPGTPPEERMWADAELPFREVLTNLSPDFVLVLGQRLWDNLPGPPTAQSAPPVELHGERRESCLYASGTGLSFAFSINHPAAYGWTYAEWAPRVEAALGAALRFTKGNSPQSQ